MYEEITREPLSPMQTVANRSSNNVSSQTRTIAFFAVLLFAIAGLISGFAVGAFIHPKTTSTTGNSGSNTKPPVVQKTQTPVSTRTSGVVWPNEPGITDYSTIESKNNNYTLSALITDKYTNKSILTSDVTCKLWLSQDGNINPILKKDDYAIPKAIGNIQQPFPEEVQNGLIFGTSTSQVQPCTTNGSKTTWNYTLSPSLNPGTYYLAVLADWKGIHYNWRWATIIVKQAN
jgi:hypothetical protein